MRRLQLQRSAVFDVRKKGDIWEDSEAINQALERESPEVRRRYYIKL